MHGLAPFWLDIGVDTVIETGADLAAYREQRGQAIERLAARDPNGQVTFRLTPAGHRPIVDVWMALKRAGAAPVGVILDVFAGNEWISRFGHQTDAGGPGTAFAGDAAQIEAFVRENLAASHRGESGYDATTLRFEVFLVRAVAPAAGLTALTADSIVALVDPEDDIRAALADRAAHVRIITMPTVPDELRWAEGGDK